MFAFKIAFVLSLFCCSSNRFRFLLVLIRFHSPSLDLTLSYSFSLSSLSSPFAFIRCRLCGRNWSNRLMIAPNQAAFFISGDWEPLGTHKTRRRNLKAQEVFELRTFAALERPINVRNLRKTIDILCPLMFGTLLNTALSICFKRNFLVARRYCARRTWSHQGFYPFGHCSRCFVLTKNFLAGSAQRASS